MGRWVVPGMEMWRRQLRLEQGRGLEELAGRLLSACRAGSCCAQIAGEFEVLLVEVKQQHHCRAELGLMLWRQWVRPETDCWGQVAFEVQRVLDIP